LAIRAVSSGMRGKFLWAQGHNGSPSFVYIPAVSFFPPPHLPFFLFFCQYHSPTESLFEWYCALSGIVKIWDDSYWGESDLLMAIIVYNMLETMSESDRTTLLPLNVQEYSEKLPAKSDATSMRD
jgi:hypothetical protein